MREQVFYVSRSKKTENTTFAVELMTPLLSFPWFVFQLFPHFFVCCGSVGMCEDPHRGPGIRALGNRNGEHAAQTMNVSSSETYDNRSMYERSCGPCSCLIVVE